MRLPIEAQTDKYRKCFYFMKTLHHFLANSAILCYTVWEKKYLEQQMEKSQALISSDKPPQEK